MSSELPMSKSFEKIILAVNPSHSHPLEHAFWENVSREAHHEGWRLVQVAARKIPNLDFAETFIIPARLWQLAEKIRYLSHEGLQPNFSWLTADDLKLLEDWEHRRWVLPQYNNGVYPGLLRLANLAETIMATLNPAVVLTTNKIDHPCYMFYRAGKAAGAYTAVIERSPFDSLWMEEGGIFRESRIWDEWPKQGSPSSSAIKRGKTIIESVLAKPAGFRDAENVKEEPAEFAKAKRPIFLLAMDNVLWTGWEQFNHPQRTIDYYYYDTPQIALERLAEQVKRLNGTLFVKKHPSCNYITPERMPQDVRLIGGDLEFVINSADVVLAFNTKVAFTAVAMGKPVVTLAPNPIAVCGATYHAATEDAVPKAIDAALRRENLAAKLETAVPFFGWLAEEYFYSAEPKDANHQLHPKDLVRFVIHQRETNPKRSYNSKIAPALENLRHLTEGGKYGFYKTFSIPRASMGREKPLKIAFDVWRLAHAHMRSFRPTGITGAVEQFYQGLQSYTDLVPTLFEDPSMNNPKYHQDVRRVLDRSSEWLQPYHPVQFPVQGLDTTYDLYFSPVNPLPPVSITQDAKRVLHIYDVIYLTEPQHWMHDSEPQIARALNSLNPATDYVIVNAEVTRHELKSLLPIPDDHIFTVPLAYNALYRQPIEKKDTKRLMRSLKLWPGHYIIALAQSDRRKNLWRLVAAYTLLRKYNRIPDYSLLLVSPNEQTRQEMITYLEEVMEAPLPSSVIIATDIDDDALAMLYSQARCMAYVSLSEGFGIPILEAMAAGCAVLTSAVSSMPEVGGNAAHYVNPHSVVSIAEGLERLCEDDAYIQQLQEAGRVRASQFSYEHTAYRLAQVLYAIAGKKMPVSRPINEAVVSSAF